MRKSRQNHIDTYIHYTYYTYYTFIHKIRVGDRVCAGARTRTIARAIPPSFLCRESVICNSVIWGMFP
jgi:hypothetical protein